MNRKFAGHAVCPTKVTATFALIAAFGLTACGGGGDNVPTVSRKGEELPPASNGIKVDGQSRSVEVSDGMVAGLLASAPSSNYGVLSSSSGGSKWRSIKAGLFSEAAPGAYMKLGDAATLLRGTITDLSGNGHYAIGRWTDGVDSQGHTYNANQGRVWVVGQPVTTATVTHGGTLTCALEAATRPVAIDGNTLPGRLTAGSATAYLGGDAPRYDLSLTYEIGHDNAQSMKATAVSLGLESSRRDQRMLFSTFLGGAPEKPYLAVAYTMQAPTVGTIHGLAVMACSR